MSIFNAMNGVSTADFSMEDMLAAMRKCQSIERRSRFRRDFTFAMLREQGHTVLALDRGIGEEWVVDDVLYDALKNSAEPAPKGVPLEVLSGITLFRASEWKE